MQNQIEKDSLVNLFEVNKSSAWINDCGNHDVPCANEHNIYFMKKLPINSHEPVGYLAVKFSSSEISRMIFHEHQLGEMTVLDEEYQVITQFNGVEPSVYIDRLQNSPHSQARFRFKRNMMNSALLTENPHITVGSMYLLFR